ncbi:MAG: NAD(P)/FAD-dependent oxidoreductase [Nanoarchaeota archaeon]
MNIAIIGAGPVGCYAGCLLAKAGHNVSIYEEHEEIGKPVQCTGILTSEFDKLGFPKESLKLFLDNTISRIEICSPHGKVEVKQREYVVCRSRFDLFFAGLAEKAGARIFPGHSFVRREGQNIIIKESKSKEDRGEGRGEDKGEGRGEDRSEDGGECRGEDREEENKAKAGNIKAEKRINPDIVIAADGPLSKTAKAFGLYHPKRKNYLGLQAVVRGHFKADKYSAYFGEKICPGMWAWIVPESPAKARVGLFSLKEPRSFFNRWLEVNHFKYEIIQAGLVPLYCPQQRLKRGRCYVLGDAAGFVKASTFGGIIPGLRQAKILADCINRNAGDYKAINDGYKREIKPLRRELWVHLQIRKILSRFSDTDWDRLLLYISQERINKVLETYTRDNPLPLVASLLLREPRFLYFLKYLVF